MLFGVGVPAPRLDGGPQHGGQRLGGLVGVVPVTGQPGREFVGGHQPGVGLQGLRVTAVDTAALPGQQIVADGLTDQRVPEAVAVAVVGGEQDLGAHGGAQGFDEFVLTEPRDGLQQPVLDGGAALGDDAGDALRGLGQCLDPDEQQVAQAVAEAGAAALGDAAGEFLDEEGVAVGTAEDPVDHARGGLGVEDAGHLGADLAAVEPGQLQAHHGTHPVELGEEGPQRVAAVDVVGAVGGQDDEPAAGERAQQVAEEFAGRAVGPVQVLEGDDERALLRQPFQQPRGELEEPGAAVLVALVGEGVGAVRPAQAGQQAGEFALAAGGRGDQFVAEPAVQGAQDRRDGGERQSVRADLHAGADGGHGPRPVLRRGEELLDEPGLADAGLAADHQRLRLARMSAGERGGEAGQFAGATDEHRADRQVLHGPEHRTGP